MTDYQAPSGAWVFAAGTIRWPWGLSFVSPWGPSTSRVSTAAQIMTNNVLNRFIGISASPTPSSIATPTPSPGATPTSTPGVTRTPTPSATPSPVAAVKLSPPSIDFHNQRIGTTSASKNETFANTGPIPVTISSISTSPPFTQTNNCPIAPSTLQPSTSCTISVSFAPTSTGRVNGSLAVTDDAPGSPQTVNLKGNGVTH